MEFKQLIKLTIGILFFASFIYACATTPQTKQAEKSPVRDKEHGLVQFTGYVVKPVIVSGEPKGPKTMVLQGYEGSIRVPTALITVQAEGKPKSGTIAIIEPIANSEDVIMLHLDKAMLISSQYEGKNLVLEVDARNSSLLLGEGSIYFIKAGIEKIRLGNYYVSTLDAKGWCLVEIIGSSQPKVEGSGIKIWPVPPKK